MAIIKPKGTKDILPKDVYKWHYVEGVFSDICRKYGYKEMRTPMFEYTELFSRGVGDTTDIVEKQMYTFQDLGERSLTLKPEGTSPIARAHVENKLYAEVQPSKYYYNIPCFRYEKNQKGRQKQFHQFGVEVFGTDNMMADAEIIALAMDFLDKLGIKGFTLRINSIGCPKCRGEYRTALQDFLKPKFDQLCSTCQSRHERNPMRILDCKSPVCQELVQGAPQMLDHICDECRDAFTELKANLESMKINFTVDPGIVRGLDYYTKTAFEIVSDHDDAQYTICGGGRYDHLIEQIGGPAIPGVGFGLGIERLLLIMEAEGAVIPEEEKPDLFIAFIGERAKVRSLGLVQSLRKQGLSVEIDVSGRNLKGQFKYADRTGAVYTLVIGDDELDKGIFTLKNMVTSTQSQVSIEELMKAVGK